MDNIWKNGAFIVAVSVVFILSIVFSVGAKVLDEGVIPIYSADDLNKIRDELSGDYRLMNDLDLSVYDNWQPIGSSANPFTGTLDGNGYTISNLIIDRGGESYIGLFGYLNGAIIKELSLNNVNVIGNHQVGSLVGYAEASTIYQAHINGTVRGNNFVGGLVGDAVHVSITDSHVHVNTNGRFHVGGLVARIVDPYIEQSFATGSVNGLDHVGGLVGSTRITYGDGVHQVIIRQSYATGDVVGNIDVGGLVGAVNRNHTASTIDAIIAESYATGTVRGNNTNASALVGYAVNLSLQESYAVGAVHGGTNAGGLVGFATSSTIVSSYWDMETTGQEDSAEGGIGLTTEEMKQRDTYTEAGWNFDETWMIAEEETYPIYRWQGDGSEERPYIIKTPQQMDFVRYGLEQYYKLGVNIDLVEYESWDPIGNFDEPFTGTLDGNDKSVSNLRITREGFGETEWDVGLFSVLNGATIKDISLLDVNIRGEWIVGGLAGDVRGSSVIKSAYVTGRIQGERYVGGLVGHLDRSVIEHSSVTATIIGYNRIGGLVGDGRSSSIIRYSSAIGTITGGNNAGGLVGDALGITIEQSFAAVEVDGSYHLGGLVGYLDDSTIRQSYATGSVDGNEDSIGGLVGYVARSTIEHSYAVGVVSGESDVGGLVGYRQPGFPPFLPHSVITFSYWDMETTGQERSAGGTGLSTKELQQQSSFEPEWDFEETWFMVSDKTYPVLIAADRQAPIVSLEPLDTVRVTSNNEEEVEIAGMVSNFSMGESIYVKYSVRDEAGNYVPGYERQHLFESNPVGTEIPFTGTLLIDNVEPGTYTIEVYAKAFQATGTSEIETIQLDVYAKPEIKVDLQITDADGELVDYTPETWTNQDVYVTIQYKHDNASEQQIALIEEGEALKETDWQTYPGNFSLRNSGQGTLYVRTANELGYVQTEVIEQIWIDAESPTSPTVSLSEEGWTNAEQVQVELTAYSDTLSGLAYIEINTGDGEWERYAYEEGQPAITVKIEKEGETIVQARTVNQAGSNSLVNEVTIRIDRTGPSAPVWSVEDGYWYDQSYVIMLDPGDDALSGVKYSEYHTGDANWINYDSEEGIYIGDPLMEGNGQVTLIARSVDHAGNHGNEESVTVGLDRTVPAPPEIKGAPEGWTNQPVSLRVEADLEQIGVSGWKRDEYRINGGAWEPVDGPIDFFLEGTYQVEVRSVNQAGSVSLPREVTIQIDQTAPKAPVIIPSTTEWTNIAVTVEIQDGEAGLSGVDYTEYKIGGDGEWKRYEDSFTLTEDGQYFIYARTWDKAGNVTRIEEIPVVQVKIAQTKPVIDVDLTTTDDQVYEPGTWTNQTISVAATFYSSAPTELEVSLDGGENWEGYEKAIEIVEEGRHTIQFKAVDEAGNETLVERLIKIDQTSPTPPIITVSDTEWTNEAVEVSIAAGHDNLSGISKTEYRLGNEGVWKRYTAPVEIDVQGETTIYARSVDHAGNTSSLAQARTKLDRQLPLLTLYGEETVIMEKGTTYEDPGASASHPRFGNLDEQIIRKGSVDPNQAGSYTLTYTVSDPAGNMAEKQRQIQVVAITSLAIEEHPREMTPEATYTIQARPVYDEDVIPTITHGLGFVSSNSSVASVEADGRVTFHQYGEVSITVSYGEQEAILDFIVEDYLLNLGEERLVRPGERYTIKGGALQITLPEDLPLGTTLIIQEYLLESANLPELISVGGVYTFTFHFPDGEAPEEVFLLSFSYDEGVDSEKLGIYYLNEESNHWEYRGGQVEEALHVITLAVPSFSTYGVFVEETVDEERVEERPEKKPEESSPEEVADHQERDREEGMDKEQDIVSDLPDTASNLYKGVMMGVLLFVIGSILWLYQRRRQKSDYLI